MHEDHEDREDSELRPVKPVVPATNPDTGKPARAGKTARAGKGKAATRSKPKTHFGGGDLVPDIEGRSRDGGVVRQFRYWVGITPSCPVESLDLAGINFPKINERILDDPMRTGRKKRVATVGAIVWLTEDKIRRMRDRLPRTVIRFTGEPGIREEKGTGQNVGDNAVRARRGQVITIPTEAEVKLRREKGKATREYVPDRQRDVPAARYMFAQLCEDQENPERGEHYPEPLEVTGLSWPDDLARLNDTPK